MRLSAFLAEYHLPEGLQAGFRGVHRMMRPIFPQAGKTIVRVAKYNADSVGQRLSVPFWRKAESAHSTLLERQRNVSFRSAELEALRRDKRKIRPLPYKARRAASKSLILRFPGRSKCTHQQIGAFNQCSDKCNPISSMQLGGEILRLSRRRAP